MDGNFTIGEVFYGRHNLQEWNALQRWNMAQMAMPNEYSNIGFFSRHGMVEQTDVMKKSDAPIQMVRGLENDGKQMTVYIRGFMTGEPQAVDATGYAPPDDNTRRTIPQTEFSFQCTEWYGPSLYMPTQKQSSDAATSIVGDYYLNIRDYMAKLADAMMVIVLSGFRGKGSADVIYDPQTAATPNQIAQSQETGFTEGLKAIHAINPISAPTRLFALYQSAFQPNAALNAAAAPTWDASHILTAKKLAALQAYRANQKRGYADWDLRPGKFTTMEGETNGEPNTNQGWALIVSPEVARDIKQDTSTQNWYQTQLAVAAANAYKNGIPEGVVGKFFDTTILEYENLSKYWSGASENVPTVRCLMLGANSAVYGYQGYKMPERFLPRNNSKMAEAIRNWGVPFHSWIAGHDSERNASLQFCFNLGMKKVQFKGPNYGKVEDKGLIAIDATYAGNQLYA